MDILKDILRSSIYDPSSIPVIECDGKNYVQEFSLEQFMMDNNILSEDVVIQDIRESNNIKDIEIVDESDEFINSIFEMCTILEALDAKEVIDVSKGSIDHEMAVDRICAFIMRRKYDSKAELDAAIKKCDRLIEDINEELKVADDKAKNSQYKFMVRFLYNIIKQLFTGFVLPLFVVKKVKFPGKLDKIANDISKKINKIIIKKDLDRATKIMYVGSLAFDIFGDAKDAYKVATNYKKFLLDYKTSIEEVKAKLEIQRKNL